MSTNQLIMYMLGMALVCVIFVAGVANAKAPAAAEVPPRVAIVYAAKEFAVMKLLGIFTLTPISLSLRRSVQSFNF